MGAQISNIKRLRQILNVFVNHGLGFFVGALGLEKYVSFGARFFLRRKAVEIEHRIVLSERVVKAFEDLGPTFIKLGQLLSTRKDQLPRELAAAFERLQDNVAPLPFSEIDRVLLEEFGRSGAEVFDEISQVSLASGSVAQVHAAKLKSGQDVVVKVKKPGVDEVIRADINILYFLSSVIGKRVQSEFSMGDPVELVKQFEVVVGNELDFRAEARNLELFQRNFANNPAIHFPEIHWDYSTSRILVMERIRGVGVGDVEGLKKSGHDLDLIADNLFECLLQQLFVDAFFHADPHPGNIIIMPDGAVAMIDCGMVGHLDDQALRSFTDCFVGLFLKDFDQMARGYGSFGMIDENADARSFKNDLQCFFNHYMNIPLQNIEIRRLLDDAIDVATRNKMTIPPDVLLVSKALVLIEGSIKKLNPRFKFADKSAAYAKEIMSKQHFDPKRLASKLFLFLKGSSDLVHDLPWKTSRILAMIEENKIRTNVTVSGSPAFYKEFHKYAGSLSLAMISAGLAVGASVVIAVKIEPLIYNLSALGVFGYLMGLVLGIWVVILIVKESKD